jgi:hypothetical protein
LRVRVKEFGLSGWADLRGLGPKKNEKKINEVEPNKLKIPLERHCYYILMLCRGINVILLFL